MLAVKDNGEIFVGWSVCNINKDRYDKILGEKIAVGRALYGDKSKVQPPRFAQKQLEKFKERAQFYFNNPNPKPKRETAKEKEEKFLQQM